MTASDLCRRWIQHSEGCKLIAYPDNGAYSIGYGHRGVPAGTMWTPAQVEAAFESDLQIVENHISSLVVVPLTQGQFDALCDFTYNEGVGNLQHSTLLRKLNVMKDYAGACRELYWVDAAGAPHGWILAGGEVNAGLIARRQGEQILWDGGNPLEGM